MQTGLPALVIVRKKNVEFSLKNDKFEIGLRQVALSNIQFVEFCIQFGLFICN